MKISLNKEIEYLLRNKALHLHAAPAWVYDTAAFSMPAGLQLARAKCREPASKLLDLHASATCCTTV